MAYSVEMHCAVVCEHVNMCHYFANTSNVNVWVLRRETGKHVKSPRNPNPACAVLHWHVCTYIRFHVEHMQHDL